MEIWALPNIINWSEMRRLDGSSLRRAVRRLVIRAFISPAAATVKVTTRSLETSTGFSLSVIDRMIRSVKVAVLPEPAAAETSRVFPRSSMAFCCCVVNSILRLSSLLFSLVGGPADLPVRAEGTRGSTAFFLRLYVCFAGLHFGGDPANGFCKIFKK